MTRLVTIAMSGAVLGALAAPTHASARQFVLIPPSAASSHTEPDTMVGQYYTISYQLPEGLRARKLDRVLLELYLDVRAKPREDYVNEAPVVEVYALKAASHGSVEPGDLDNATRAGRPVALGSSRRVLVDVTKIVVAQLSGTLQNNGLVVGSMTGEREGDFTLLSNRLPGGAVGRLRIYTTD
jgi:hypothetical protein